MADDHWLRSELTESEPGEARRAGVALCLTVAASAAVTVPGVEAGIQIPVLAVGAWTAAVLLSPRSLTPVDGGAAVLAGALVALVAIRDASWILGFDILAAAGLGGVALTGARTWRGIVSVPLALVGRVPKVPRFLLQTGAGRRPRRALVPVLRGTLLGGAFLLVFGGLFASADPAFADLAERLLIPDVDLGLVPARVVVFVVAVLGIGAAGTVGRTAEAADQPVTRRFAVAEWMIALGLVDALFLTFVAVQLAVLFGGHTHVLETAGLTYAEYARSGFFQLLAVAALTLAVIAGAVRWARRDRDRDTRALQILLGTLCVCTIVILVSAFRRLDLYEAVFGSTRLRISVRATILWMAALFGLLIVAGVRMRGAWLPRATLALSAASLIAFTAMDPDAMIAERNVRRFHMTGELDLDYARSLSSDAVPVLAKLPAGLRCWALEPMARDLRADEAAVGWNLARVRARAVLAARMDGSTCDTERLARFPGVTWTTS